MAKSFRSKFWIGTEGPICKGRRRVKNTFLIQSSNHNFFHEVFTDCREISVWCQNISLGPTKFTLICRRNLIGCRTKQEDCRRALTAQRPPLTPIYFKRLFLIFIFVCLCPVDFSRCFGGSTAWDLPEFLIICNSTGTEIAQAVATAATGWTEVSSFGSRQEQNSSSHPQSSDRL
jgi:hypothetical protein